MESGIQTDKQRVDMGVAAVGSQMQVQEAVRQEIWSAVNILHAGDDQIVQ
jgi:hypothetical protein